MGAVSVGANSFGVSGGIRVFMHGAIIDAFGGSSVIQQMLHYIQT